MNDQANQPKVYIAGTGMITPIGANTAMTAAAVRAGVSGYRYTDFYVGDDEYVRMALVPEEALENSLNEETLTSEYTTGEYTARRYRLLQLAKLALEELKPALPQNVKLPLFIAGPEQLFEGDQPINGVFLQNLAKQTGVNLDLAMSRIISTGRAGGLAAVNLAFRFFASGEESFAIVAGVDTFYDGAVVQTLQKDERLLAGGNMDGFIPGEGAAFILLCKHKVPLHKNTDKIVCLYEAGLGNEPGHRASKEPYRGDGLASTVATALANAKTAKIKTLYSSMNGEHFFAKEHGVAMIRNSEFLEEHIKIEHPADCFGDLGAAFGPVAVGIIATHLLNNKIGSPCIVCCSSDKESRGAVVMHP